MVVCDNSFDIKWFSYNSTLIYTPHNVPLLSGVQPNGHPALIDIDNDGDNDLFVGMENQFVYFENTSNLDTICCDENQNIVQNGSVSGLNQGISSGNLIAGGPWIPIGTPQVDNNHGCNNNSCNQNGCFVMWGNQVVGEAVAQKLTGAFIAGHTYDISFCSRYTNIFHNPPPSLQHSWVKLTAANNLINPYLCTGSSCTTIGQSALMDQNNVWINTCITWTPADNYDYIIFSVENNSTSHDLTNVSWAEIDDICIQDVGVIPTPCMKIDHDELQCDHNTGNYLLNLDIVNISGTNAILQINPSVGNVNFTPTVLLNGDAISVNLVWSPLNTMRSVCFTFGLYSQADTSILLCDTMICFQCEPCPIHCSCPFEFSLDSTDVHQSSYYHIAFNNSITANNPLLQVRANVVSVDISQYCMSGYSVSYTSSGTFVSASTNPSLTQGLGTSELTYTNDLCPNASGVPFNFELDIPSPPVLNCYQDIKVCIRYTITDCECNNSSNSIDTICQCNTCDTLICYNVRRRFSSVDPNGVISSLENRSFLNMKMNSATKGTLTISNPIENDYTAGLYLYAISIKAAQGIKITSMQPGDNNWSPGKPSDEGLTSRGILNPGKSLLYSVEYENPEKLKEWMNRIKIEYSTTETEDTLVGIMQIKSRIPEAAGGDEIINASGFDDITARAKTIAVNFLANNYYKDEIAKIIIKVKDGQILAIGPQLSTNDASFTGYHTYDGQWKLLSSSPNETVAVIEAIPPGTVVTPLFITLVNEDEKLITLEYQTYATDNNLITDGVLEIKTPDTGVDDENIGKTTIFLSEAIPNPARNTALIKFRLNQYEPFVSLIVSDVTGRIVQTLINKDSYAQGDHEVNFDTSKLTSGTYYYTLSTSSASLTRKLVVIK